MSQARFDDLADILLGVLARVPRAELDALEHPAPTEIGSGFLDRDRAQSGRGDLGVADGARPASEGALEDHPIAPDLLRSGNQAGASVIRDAALLPIRKENAQRPKGIHAPGIAP